MQVTDKPSVLIVDDERQVLVAVEDVLEESFRVLTAESAQRALDTLAKEPNIAVVITDQRMPRMTGDELLVRMRHTCAATSILLTGFADLGAVVRAVNEGRIFAYVTKPWNPDDLLLKVGKAAEHFELTKNLAHERQLLRDLMDSATDLIFFKDTELRFTRVNRAFVDFFEAGDADRVTGKRLDELGVESQACEESAVEDRELLDRGFSSSDRVRSIEIRGSTRWLSTTKTCIRSHGTVIGLVGIARDITERVRAGEALAESEQRLRDQSRLLNSILDCMGEGVIAADRDGAFVLFNREAQRILGRGAVAAPADQWGEAYGLFLPDQSTPLATSDNPLVRAMQGEDVPERELFVKNATMPGASVAMTATALVDESSVLAGGIAVLRDVTAQKRLEQQLMQSQKMEAIGLLAGGVAHDFNNLLAVISSYGEFLLQSFAEDDPAREDVSEILSASQRATSLTRQLLAFSRRQIIEPRVVDLNEIVSGSEKMLGRILGEDVQLRTVLAPTLGTLKADVGQLEQILLNLSVNARDAMPDGGILTIATENVELPRGSDPAGPDVPPGPYVLWSVTDSGSGIDDETQRRMFEPFFTTKGLGKGTGLGLSTVYGIVKQAGGHLVVRSRVGQGAEFRIYFPRLDAPADLERPMEPFSQSRVREATILVVEDDDAVRRLAARILRREGYEVIESRSPKEAKAICGTIGDRIDLLVTDVVMPGLSGPRLAEDLSQLYPKLRTLYISGYPGGALRDGASRPDGPLLMKPFTPDSLAQKVREVLDRPRDAGI